MSTAVRPVPAGRTTTGTATLRQLALADARRYARHPLYLVGTVLAFAGAAPLVAISRQPDPVAEVILPAFCIGVFGFVVAHRLTTSMRRTEELVETLPAPARRRTLALCLACLVPFATMLACTAMILVLTVAYPPQPAGAPMAWFGQEPWPTVLAAVIALGPVAGLGGPLLGVVVGTWAPFRGSALVGVVLLTMWCSVSASTPTGTATFWRAVPPWSALTDEPAVHGAIVSSNFVPHLSPLWYLVYVVLLCALCVVVALLREQAGRRPLLWAAGGMVVAAGGALAMTVS